MNVNTQTKENYKGNNRLLVGIVLAVLTFWLFSQSFMNIAPVVQKDLNLSSGVLNIGVSITSLFSALFIVLAGKLSDEYGRMKFVYIGIFFNIIGSLILITMKNPVFFVLGRIFQGIAPAAIMPATLSLIKVYFDGKDRERALSYWSMGSWGGSGLSSFFGGTLQTYFGWRSIFALSIIISIISLLLIRKTPESVVNKDKESKFDTFGLIIFIISMLALNLFITKGSSFGWLSLISILLVIVFVVGIIIFYNIEDHSENAFIDFGLFKNINYSAATISNLLLNAVGGTVIVINSYGQQGRGLNADQSGLLTLGYLVFVLLTIRLGEKILQKLGAKFPMVLGSLIAMIGILLMNLTFFSNVTYFVFVFIGYSLFGIGLGLYATPSTATAIASVSNEKVGVASGIYKMASSLGAALGISISESIYNSFANHTIGANFGLCVDATFALLALISILLLLKKR